MFYTIIDNELKEYCDVKANMLYSKLAKELAGVSVEYFNENKDKFTEKDGQLADISRTKEYLAKKKAREVAVLKVELQKKIDELDMRRVRAIAEPELKDESTTWLEHYTLQIKALRTQIAEL